MSRLSIEQVKAKKYFYRDHYRYGLIILLASLVLNLLLLVGIFLLIVTKEQPDYYATSGVTSPIWLIALDEPNMTSEPLLEPDPIEEMVTKEFPL